MKKSFTNATPHAAKTQTDVWITPSWIMEAMGDFDLDPCGHIPDNNIPITATAKHYFTEEDDGLKQKWFGDVFVNFPYSDGKAWMTKCKNEYLSGNAKSVVILCFARTETQAWQHNVKSATGINFVNKRIKFLTGDGIEKGNGNAPSCLIAFGESAFAKIKNIDGIITRIVNDS